MNISRRAFLAAVAAAGLSAAGCAKVTNVISAGVQSPPTTEPAGEAVATSGAPATTREPLTGPETSGPGISAESLPVPGWAADSTYLRLLGKEASQEGSGTGWFMRVDVTNSRVAALSGAGSSWQAVRCFDANLGKRRADGLTCTGLYQFPSVWHVAHRSPDASEGYHWFTCFIEHWIGDYDDGQGFHDGLVKADIGAFTSQGCPRLTTQGARWVYDTIPDGTPVLVDYEPKASA